MRAQSNKVDYFGFLPAKWHAKVADFIIEPIQEYDKVLKKLNKLVNRDGYIYPPISKQCNVDPITFKLIKVLPRTKKPAHLFQLPPSHKLTIRTDEEINDLRNGSSGFLIHLISYLYGTRLQFSDWWFDGRVPFNGQHNITVFNDCVQDFLSKCYNTWKSWGNDEKKLITNILYMHCRSVSYEWDWERFAIEYMVFDGCFKLMCMIDGINPKNIKHEQRIIYVCKRYGIPIEASLVKDIIRLRNQLFHETLWDNSRPGTAMLGTAFYRAYNLRSLNQRIIPALLNYVNDYVKSGWWCMGSFSFKAP